MERLNKNKGITLIALVITIIVLLILAGITINLTLGQDGIMNMAEKAGQNYIDAEQKEKNELANLENQMNSIIVGSNRDTVTLTQEEYQIFKNQTTFSNDEKQIGTWIDGKPLYQKTIIGLNIPMSWNNQNLTQSSAFAPLISDVDRVIDVPSAKCEPASGGYIAMSVDLRVLSDGNWWICGIEDYPITELTIIYTKTTDVIQNY